MELQTKPSLPLWPVLVLTAGIHQLHVEKRGKDEGEKCDSGGPHQVQDCSKAGHRLRYEEQAEDRNTPERTSLPVEVRRNMEKLFKGLGGRVCDDWKCCDEMEEQHHLHHHPLPPAGHGQHDVVLDLVSQGEVAADSHREVYEEENWRYEN